MSELLETLDVDGCCVATTFSYRRSSGLPDTSDLPSPEDELYWLFVPTTPLVEAQHASVHLLSYM